MYYVVLIQIADMVHIPELIHMPAQPIHLPDDAEHDQQQFEMVVSSINIPPYLKTT